MREFGLYYPYVRVQDEAWLKASALYWQHMGRVVAEGYPVTDTETGRALQDGLDYFIPVDPGEARSAIEPVFLEVLNRNAPALRDRYAVDPRPGRAAQVLPALRRTRRYMPPGGSWVDYGGYVAHLYSREVAPRLREVLIEEGLSMPLGRNGRQSLLEQSIWISMDPMVAWVYKCALTSEIARRERLVPTTDQIAAHRAGREWDAAHIEQVLLNRSSAAPRDVRNPAELLGELAVQMVIPENLAEIPVKKIIELRVKHQSEFSAFLNAVFTASKEAQEELAEIESREVLAAYLKNLHQERFAKELEDLKAAMKGVKIASRMGIMNLQTPALVGASLGAIGGIVADKPYVVAAGTALGFVAHRHTVSEQRRELLRSSQASFLMHVEEGLRPAGLMRRLTRGMRRTT